LLLLLLLLLLRVSRRRRRRRRKEGGRHEDNGPGLGPARVSSAGFDQWSLFFSKKNFFLQFCDIENFAKFSPKKNKEKLFAVILYE
jgi:hypothetical protein